MGYYPKVGITGWTSGIGRALYEHFKQVGCAVRGYSRTNRFNLEDPWTVTNIVEDTVDLYLDVFINNAYSDFRQVELLYALWEEWKDQDKMIINISSNSGDGIKNKVHSYAVHKTALDKACEQLAYQDFPCKVVNLRPGWVNTPRVASVANVIKLNIQDIVTVVDVVIKNKNVIHFHELTFRAW